MDRMPSEMIDRTIFVVSKKMRVRILQLNDSKFKLTGTPASQAEPGDEVVSNLTELEGIYISLGLMEGDNITRAVNRRLARVWQIGERPISEGWVRIRTVNEWKRLYSDSGTSTASWGAAPAYGNHIIPSPSVTFLVEGSGTAVLNGEEQPFEAGDAVMVPAGTKHNFVAGTDAPLKIINTYAPPHHPDGLIHESKAQADAEGN
jgi:uncharacterized cupin superfamily protein